ncbi:prolyl endopeptidase [Croceicoccus estronivorus]|uniref:prolyl oligopeptidase family serine peptidase n=1 Tax=Croceicoccus estronivorus TaxID=1172626 RepID=UPI00082B4260|nr:prolyl oligopeptidase family serine peptidase [Croceicoccus estronivorus]OCC22804.1 prolyl endopeptidase [Croceicoccus estronivorus]
MRRFARYIAGAPALCLMLAQQPLAAQNATGADTTLPTSQTTLGYPETRRDDVVEQLFGEKISDPYRWLEDDVRNNAEVADWVARENAVTQAYLDRLPDRAWFSSKIGELMDYERFSIPVKAGGRYFYERNAGLQNQSQLFMRKGLKGKPQLLLDPAQWSDDGTTALDAWKPSPDGRYVLYSIQDDGSDWRRLAVLDVRNGENLPDTIRWAKFTSLAWIGDEGFLYSRFPEPEEGQDFQALNYNQAIYFHRLGTDQGQDELVFATPDHPERSHYAEVTYDGRWAVITSAVGTDARYEIHVIDLAKRGKSGWFARPLITGFDNAWNLIEGVGGVLWFTTNEDAPRFRVVAIDLDALSPRWYEVVRQSDETINAASLVGDRLVISYLKDAASRALIFELGSGQVDEVLLNGLGTASGFTGKPGDPETFYSFASFNRPAGIYRMDLSTKAMQPFALPELTFDPEAYLVEQRFYTSKDGTKVPMFIVRKRSVAGANRAVPTLLYGYGGFDISLTPGFSAVRMAWLEAGGAFALANIRGGGEYGKDWHDAGRLGNKQNVFDDFIAAGEYLKREGITPANGLAIEGRSNGGLLMGAVTNQRPDLFDAVHAAVGVMDMLRFDRWTAGRYWVDDYGHPDREEDFRVLRSYSPYHNIHSGADYPAILVTTADTDDRVVPGHSFKYAAALQAADIGSKPHLIRIETGAGHGSGKPTDKQIAEGADVLAFLANWTGLHAPAHPAVGRSEK